MKKEDQEEQKFGSLTGTRLQNALVVAKRAISKETASNQEAQTTRATMKTSARKQLNSLRMTQKMKYTSAFERTCKNLAEEDIYGTIVSDDSSKGEEQNRGGVLEFMS